MGCNESPARRDLTTNQPGRTSPGATTKTWLLDIRYLAGYIPTAMTNKQASLILAQLADWHDGQDVDQPPDSTVLAAIKVAQSALEQEAARPPRPRSNA